MHTVFALLCFVVVLHWLIFPYPSGLLHWHCGNLTIASVPAKQPWWIWINTSCEFIMNDCITTTKQSTTKPCAYFLGYTVRFVSCCILFWFGIGHLLIVFRAISLTLIQYYDWPYFTDIDSILWLALFHWHWFNIMIGPISLTLEHSYYWLNAYESTLKKLAECIT